MILTGLHVLLTYQCTLECEHCFVWGSPQQTGTLTLDRIETILRRAQDLGTIDWIYFEGGEPFLYYPVLLRATETAATLGFQVGMVSNGYWATSYDDALEWLRPFAGFLQDLSISSDLYHGDSGLSQQAANAQRAAQQLGIPVGIITIAQPEEKDCGAAVGQLPIGQSAVMYRGRAAEKLTHRASRRP